MKKKLYRSSTDKMICGVLAGFAAGFPGILFYIICAIVIPQKPFDVEP